MTYYKTKAIARGAEKALGIKLDQEWNVREEKYRQKMEIHCIKLNLKKTWHDKKIGGIIKWKKGTHPELYKLIENSMNRDIYVMDFTNIRERAAPNIDARACEQGNYQNVNSWRFSPQQHDPDFITLIHSSYDQ